MNDEIHSITDLPESRDDDLNKRMKVYFVIMSMRVVAFLVVLVVPGWWKVLPAIFAVFSSWFAVLIANAIGMFQKRQPGIERPTKELT